MQENAGEVHLQKVFLPDSNQELYMDEHGNVYDADMNCIGKIEEGDEEEGEGEDMEEMEGELEQGEDLPPQRNNKQFLGEAEPEEDPDMP